LFVFAFSVFWAGFLSQIISSEVCSILLGLSVIFLAFSIIYWVKESFFNSKLRQPKIGLKIKEVIERPKEYNLAEFLSFKVALAVDKSLKLAKLKGFSEIDSTILFYFLLADNPELNFIFSRALLNLKEIKKILKEHLEKTSPKSKTKPSSISYQQDFQDSILESLKVAQKKGHQRIETGDIITALAKHNPIFKKILIDADLKIRDIENLTWWLESLEEKIEERKKFWEYKNLAKKGSLAKEWAAGYTITLDQYSIDWTDLIKKRGFEEIIGHTEEIEEVERILSRLEINNVLLVGEPGTGRGSIVQAIAQKSLFGESLPQVNYKRVVELDMPSLLAKVESLEEAERALDRIFQEVLSAGNIILVIDEFHNYAGGKARPGVINISGILSGYLKLPQFQIVAITSFAGLHKYIEQNPSILALLEKVEVSEISQQETIMLLEKIALGLEPKYKKFVSYRALRDIISHTSRYLPAIPFPKKAIDLLDEVMVYVSRKPKDKLVLPEHVAKVISEKTDIPVGEIETKEREVLLNLENLIHKRIINQDEAVREVSAALRRARAEVTIRKGPMGGFLFLGPTGVGKTETSKALAEIYFGGEQRMIRLDMSEFQTVSDIPRLIGSTTQEGILTTQIREDPFSLILLDEVEKAHPDILNLFLQVLDEGHLTDGLGRKVSFLNSIIIATSNAGAEIIWEDIRKDKKLDIIKEDLLSYLFKKGIFRPEFINRFDAVVVFKPLTKENLLDISELMLQKLKKNLKEKEIEFIITKPLKEKIVELGYSPVFGARQMRRVIQDKIENVLAQALLSRQLKRGNRVEVDSKNFTLKINP